MRELLLDELRFVAGGLLPQDPVDLGGITVHPNPGQGGSLPYSPPSTGPDSGGGGGSSNPGGTAGGLTTQQKAGLARVQAQLGIDLTAYAQMSPTLAQEIANATATYNFNFVYDPSGSKTVFTNSISGTIHIGSAYQGNADNIVQQLAHEFGHMEHPVAEDPSKVSADQYVRDNLTGEGYATIWNERVEHEILAAGGNDIRIATGNEGANRPLYDSEYTSYSQGHELLQQAAQNIGAIYGQHEMAGGVSYETYYREYYYAHGGTQ